MNSKELKPCPFCGGKAKAWELEQLNWVACANEDCLINPSTSVFHDIQKAIDAWNRRVTDEIS